MDEPNLAVTITRLREGYLQPAVEAATAHPGMLPDAVLFAQCEAALTSCAGLSGTDMQALALQYRAYRDEALTLFLQLRH